MKVFKLLMLVFLLGSCSPRTPDTTYTIQVRYMDNSMDTVLIPYTSSPPHLRIYDEQSLLVAGFDDYIYASSVKSFRIISSNQQKGQRKSSN